jgi:hypothetical protein
MCITVWPSISARLICSILLFLLQGCSWVDSNGINHTLIIGFGYVSQASATGISAADMTVAGIAFDHGISLGLMKKMRVEINPNTASNAIVSIKAAPFSLAVKNFNQNENFTQSKEKQK